MNDKTTTIQELKKKVRRFREERGWLKTDQKDIALSIVLEAGEILEHFQWVKTEEVIGDKRWRQAVGEEMADVLFLMLEMAEVLEVDLANAFEKKVEKQAKKYPLNQFNKDIPMAEQLRAYYEVKAKTRGGHPLAEKVGKNDK